MAILFVFKLKLIFVPYKIVFRFLVNFIYRNEVVYTGLGAHLTLSRELIHIYQNSLMHRTSNDLRIRKGSFSQFYTVINFSRLIRNLPLELLRWPSKLTLFVWHCPTPFNPHIFPNKIPSYFKISLIRRISSSAVKFEPFLSG